MESVEDSKQSSGIEPISSHNNSNNNDDDDKVSVFNSNPLIEIDNSVEKSDDFVEESKNFVSNRSSNGSIDVDSGSNVSFMSGEEVFETPLADPDEETIERVFLSGGNGVSGDNNDGFFVGEGGEVGKDGFLSSETVEDGVSDVTVGNDGVLLSSGVVEEGGLGFGDESDVVVDSINVDVGEVVRSGVVVVGVDEREESSEVEVGEVKAVDECGSVVEESEVLSSGVVEGGGSEFGNESDAIVDSINVDVAEAVRSGVVVVGVDEKEEMGEVEGEKVKPVDESGSVVEENEVLSSGVVEGGGSKFGNESDSIVDSINVDVVEAVRSGVAVVGVEGSDVGSKMVEVEEVKPANESSSDDVIEPGVVSGVEVEERKDPDVELENEENSVIEEFAKAVSMDVEESTPMESKPIVEEDSVVDEIHVDAVEVVRSGIAVVGDSGGEDAGTEVTEVGVPVGEKVTLGNEFEPLVDANEGPETFTENNVASTEHEEHVEAQVEQVAVPQEPLSKEDVNPETEGELEDVSGEDEGKVLLDDDEDKPQPTSAVVGGETVTDRSYASVLLNGLEVTDSDKPQLHEKVEETKSPNPEVGAEAEDDENPVSQEELDVGNVDGESKSVLSSSEADASQLVEEIERGFVPSEGFESQIVTDSEEEEADSDEEGEGKEMFDSAALAALLKAATSAGSDSGTITITSQDGSRLFSVERPAGLGPSLRSVRPASRPVNSSLLTPSNVAVQSDENLSEEEKKKLQHMQQLRVKFLRLVQRLGYTEEDSIAAQVLYRLALLAGRPTSPAFSLENAKQTATQLEAEGKDDLDFSLTILVLGKTGVGKSATINSIFGEEKVKINAFEPETTSVNEINGIIDGVKIRVIDAPGLKTSGMEQGFNRKVLASVKKFTKKYPPDIMFYVDRLDSQTRDLNDLPVLKTITSSLGSSIWRSAIVTLTHAACAPPDGPSGSPLSYEVFVANRSHIVQQFIGQAVGDLRLMNPSAMNPVSLVENHPACRKNREGQRVLPNGQAWRPQLLLLSYSLKVLAEANSSLKPQDPFDHRKLFGFRVRSAPLPYLLSTMLQPRAHPKLAADQGGDNGDSDIDLDDLSDSDQEEEEDEYDQLPPFKPLRKVQLAKLSKDQKKAYLEEYDYRVKLLQRKQWREELKRMREMKKKGKSDVDGFGENPDDFDTENEAPAAVPVPLPDMVLPPSFDSDNPAYRYRFLEPTSQFLARPVLDTHGWDHDCGYDGVNLEQNIGIAGRFPASATVQVTKDKKECNLHLDSSIAAKHGENGSSLIGFDIQTIGKQPAYIIRGETKSKLVKKNKTGAGVSVTFLGENVATGVKLEDQLNLGKRLVLLGSAGTVRSQKDAAYGANLEVRLREADYPIGQDQSSLNLSLMKWRGDLAIGGNLQSQISVGRGSKMAVRVSLNNKLSGQISVRTSSSDHLQLALAGLIPIALSIYRNFKPSVSENYSFY